MKQPTIAEIDAQSDILDRAEPQHSSSKWRPSFDMLNSALTHARRIRNLIRIPLFVISAGAVIAFHGEAWDREDLRNFFVVQFIALAGIHFIMTKVYPALEREARIGSLLRYYGADVPVDEGMT
jgi:hypothetical protein